jgi:uncharacterized protein YggE
MRRFGSAGLASAALVTLLSLPGVAVADATSVRVSGEATLSAPPDVATLRLGVVTEHASSQRSVEANAEQTQAVIGALRKLVGDAADLRTEGFSLQPQYDRGKSNAEPTLRSYRTSNTVALRLAQLDRIGAAIDAAVGAGANQVQSLSFGLKDDRELRARALAEATRRARTKADVVAEALGRKISRVVSVEEGGAVHVPRPYEGVRMMEAAATPIEVGDVEVRASVVLAAELKD